MGVERLPPETLGRRFTHSLSNQQHCCAEGKLSNAIHYLIFNIQLKYNLGILNCTVYLWDHVTLCIAATANLGSHWVGMVHNGWDRFDSQLSWCTIRVLGSHNSPSNRNLRLCCRYTESVMVKLPYSKKKRGHLAFSKGMSPMMCMLFLYSFLAKPYQQRGTSIFFPSYFLLTLMLV